jgi:hypothetical protein
LTTGFGDTIFDNTNTTSNSTGRFIFRNNYNDSTYGGITCDNIKCSGTSNITGYLDTTTASSTYATKASPTFTGTLSLGLLSIKSGYKADVLATNFVQYEIPNTGTHYFWDNVEVSSMLYASGGITTTGTTTCNNINCNKMVQLFI